MNIKVQGSTNEIIFLCFRLTVRSSVYP